MKKPDTNKLIKDNHANSVGGFPSGMTTPTNNPKTLKGVVTSDKMDKTVVVSVSSFVKHPKYGKYLKRDKSYKAHDEKNQAKVGETVIIRECRPMSKDKSFEVIFEK